MNNYAQIKQIIEQYIEKNGFDTDIESSIKETSYDKTNNSYLCDFGEGLIEITHIFKNGIFLCNIVI